MAKTFFITSESEPLIRAMWSELKQLGYITEADDYSLDALELNYNAITNKFVDYASENNNLEDYKSLCASDTVGGAKEFTLPKDWNETLAFAKEQIESFDAIKQEKTSEFILPKRWCVKDCPEVSKYAANKWDCANTVGEHYYMETKGSYRFCPLDFCKKLRYTEITLEQFKQYVLKEIITFGKTRFTCHKGYAECFYGKVTKAEIKSILDYFDQDIFILGHKMSIVNKGDWFVKFGCQQDKLSKIREIYNNI